MGVEAIIKLKVWAQLKNEHGRNFGPRLEEVIELPNLRALDSYLDFWATHRLTRGYDQIIDDSLPKLL
jgi:hypothetical protein